jgi:hypothetical protein
MDTLSHTLRGYGLFGYKRYAAVAMLLAAMPDLISFGSYMVLQLIQGTWHFGPSPMSTLLAWLFSTYLFGHSFIVSLTTIGLVALWRNSIAFARMAWPFHIVLDFPFHSLKFFPTPIFWPISGFKFDGTPWSHWYIWLPNVAGIILLFNFRCKHKT